MDWDEWRVNNEKIKALPSSLPLTMRSALEEETELSYHFSFVNDEYCMAFVLANMYTVGLASISYYKNERSCHINAIETLYEHAFIGSRMVDAIFRQYDIDDIRGVSIDIAGYFWGKVGAVSVKTGLPIEENCDDEDFILKRDDFYRYYNKQMHKCSKVKSFK